MNAKNWFFGLASREQFIVAALAIVTMIAVLYLFVVEPLQSGITNRQNSVVAQQRDLQWMQQQAAMANPSAGVSGGQRKQITKAPYLLLDDAIRRAKIKAPERVEPDGSQGAKAQFAEVEFDKLLQVLAELEQTYGISVKTINVSKKGEGMVSARLSLEVPQ